MTVYGKRYLSIFCWSSVRFEGSELRLFAFLFLIFFCFDFGKSRIRFEFAHVKVRILREGKLTAAVILLLPTRINSLKTMLESFLTVIRSGVAWDISSRSSCLRRIYNSFISR